MRRSRSSGHVKTGNLMSPPVSIGYLVLWGLIATLAMTTILQGAQGLGLSRLSLPFLFGTFFTGDRRRAVIIGFTLYTIGGWVFAFLYFLFFTSLGFLPGGSVPLPVSCTACCWLPSRCPSCRSCIPGWHRSITAQRRYGSSSRPGFSE